MIYYVYVANPCTLFNGAKSRRRWIRQNKQLQVKNKKAKKVFILTKKQKKYSNVFFRSLKSFR